MRLLLAFWLFLTSLATAGQRIYPVASMPVSKLVVFDVQRVNDYAERCLVASAQGIYNSRPLATDLVYLVWSQEDAFWLDWLKKNRGIQTRQLANMAQLIALGSRDCVVYDEHPGHLPNIATMISGVNRWLMAGDPELVHRFHLKVRADLSGRFQTNAAAYDWVWTKYGHSFSRQCTSFTVPYRTPTHNPAQLRDYLVANKVFTFWTSGSLDSMISGGNREAEERKVGTILREGFPLCTPVLGYPWSGDGYGPGEGDGLTFLSWLGKFLVPTDNFSNLSVWSTFPVSLKKLQTSAPEEVVFDANKTYASLVMSDGDNLCTFENYWPNYWRELGKVDFPVGWTMGPTLRELAPPIYEYALEHLGPDQSVGSGVSGLGYVAVDQFGKGLADPVGALHQFVERTETACFETGEDWLWLMRYGSPGSVELARYCQSLRRIGVVMGGYGAVSKNLAASREVIGGVSVFHSILDGGNPEEMTASLDKMMSLKDHPRFFQIFLLNWNWPAAKLIEFVAHCRTLGIEIVKPTTLARFSRIARN